MTTGTIKWFDKSKGYGFIISGDREAFFHKSQVHRDDLDSIQPQSQVSFDLYERSNNRYEAVNIRILWT